MEEKAIENGEFVVKDSGEREVFDTGAKRDTRLGKGRFDLIPPTMLDRLAKIYEAGAVKYGEHNYRKGMPLSRIMDSAIRHINKYRLGCRDEDHIGQAIWNLSAIIEIQYLIKAGKLDPALDDLDIY